MGDSLTHIPLINVAGSNFSGRSYHLKSLQNLDEAKKQCFLYIGEQPSNFITGIFPTVKSEIDLHTTNTSSEILKIGRNLLYEYNFEKLFNRNPFTLSGGEQTILVILSGLLLQPDILAIDTTLEQLNQEWRIPLLSTIQNGLFYNSTSYISDNRVKEYNLFNSIDIIPINQKSNYKYNFEKPFLIDQLKITRNSHNIELADISFAYDKNEIILDNLNVCLEPGNIYHLIGENGAGKTTLAKLLTGILNIKKGKLIVDGKEHNAFKYPGHFVSYSFQNPDEQFFSSTIESEVLFPLKIESNDYSERREIFIEMFGLKSVKKCHPAELPFVMRKRISLAATLALDKAWYILDEPTLGQDDTFVDFLVLLLNDLTKKGKGIIIISHSISFTNKLSIKNLYLNHGKLIY